MRGVQQRGFQRGSHQGFEVAAADLGVGVFGGDDLALFGQADLAVHGARGLGQDGLVARAAATSHGAAAAVEEAQRQRADLAQLVEQLDQRDLGAVELPGRGEHAAVLVAVGVAEHDVLFAAAAVHQAADAGQRIELAHDLGRDAQVADGLEQRHDDQVAGGVAVQRAAQQPGLLQQQGHFQQVADRLGVADDVVAQRLAAEAGQRFARGLEGGELELGLVGVGPCTLR